MLSREVPLATLVHPRDFVSPFAVVGPGCTVMANAVIHTNATVGMGCIINTAAFLRQSPQPADQDAARP